MSNHEAHLDHFMNRGYLLNLKLRGMQSATAVFNSAINLARYWQNPKIKYLFQLSSIYFYRHSKYWPQANLYRINMILVALFAPYLHLAILNEP